MSYVCLVAGLGYSSCFLSFLHRLTDALQFNDLMKKKRIVVNDKTKISELITELDQKKNEALHGAWERVNKVGRETERVDKGTLSLPSLPSSFLSPSLLRTLAPSSPCCCQGQQPS